MTSLSIVIPLQTSAVRMEQTLVSVLEHRPHDCEVLVVLNQHYDDPYALDDEVRFVEARQGADWAESINAGLQHACADVAFVTQAGVEATAGWCQGVLEQFDDPLLASVAPSAVDAEHPHRAIACGVGYRIGGRRWLLRKPRAGLLGPTCLAGFYRRGAVLTCGGFAPRLGEAADVDLALRLEYAGYRSLHEPASVVKAQRPPRARGFLHGLRAERLFLRNAPLEGWFESLALHPLAIARDLLGQSLHPLSALASLSARPLAWLQFPSLLRHRRLLQELTEADVCLPLERREAGTESHGERLGRAA